MTEMISNEASPTTPSSPRNPILLRRERVEDFEALLWQLKQEIEPRGFVEEMYVEEVAVIIWDIMRYRRIKSSILGNVYKTALKNILLQILHDPNEDMYRVRADKLATAWFTEPKARASVTALLDQRQLDEDSILAEAFRLTAPEIERIDQMIAICEVRRDRAIRNVAEYRLSFAKTLEQGSDRILENEAQQTEEEGNIDEPEAN